MTKRSLTAARTKALRTVREALKPPGTLAFAGNQSGTVIVPGRPTCIYARLARQPQRVVVAELGAAPPANLENLRDWLIEIKEIVDQGTVRYRVINWLRDALGRSVSEATYAPSPHNLDPSAGPHVGDLDTYYYTKAELSGEGGARLIGIEDVEGLYDADNVEDALEEALSESGARAYRHSFSDEATIEFAHPYSEMPSIEILFDTTFSFGLQPFGTSPFGGLQYWTQVGPLAPIINVIYIYTNRTVRVELSEAASGVVLCHV